MCTLNHKGTMSPSNSVLQYKPKMNENVPPKILCTGVHGSIVCNDPKSEEEDDN